jgi:hypothetical protein
MTCKPFSLNVPEGWFTKAAEEIKAAGGSIQGDAGSGEFSVPVPVLGVVAGKYMVAASELQITITQRPFLLPCASIQSFVHKQFGRK